MAITGKIKWDEGPLRAGSSASGVLEYFLHSDDPANDGREDALVWLSENTPLVLFNLTRDTLDINERISDNPDEAIWDGTVNYKSSENRPPQPLKTKESTGQPNTDGKEESRISVRSGSGQSVTRVRSLRMIDDVYRTATSFSPWNWGNDPQVNTLLNLQADADGESATMFVAQGIPDQLHTVELVLETVRTNESVQAGGYLVQAALAVNKTNIHGFFGFPEESLLLTNVDSKQRGGEEGDTFGNISDWDVTFTFAYSPEVTVQQLDAATPAELKPPLGSNTWTGTNQNKRGWWYLDILYVNEEYATAVSGTKFSIPQAKRMSTHQIYEPIDFAAVLKVYG